MPFPDSFRLSDHPGDITWRSERDRRLLPSLGGCSHYLYLALVNNPVDCAIEGAAEKDHQRGPNRECAELEYIHSAWSRSLT